MFTGEEELMVIGTAAHEWVIGREHGARAWGSEAIRLAPGEPVAWEQGSVAWAADRPSFTLGERRVPIRILAVMLKDGATYKIVTAHFSVGVPDVVAAQNAEEWSQVRSSEPAERADGAG